MKMSRKVTLACLALFFSGTAAALDIPLAGGSGGSGGGQKIGYVDMEKIFQIFPQTKFAKEDYAKRLAKKRELLAQKEQELVEIRERIVVLEKTYSDLKGGDASAAPEEGSLDSSLEEPDALLNLKNELREKELDLVDQRKAASQELESFEKQQSQLILGKIYQALKDLAQEEQVTLVVDKSSILFGSAEIDLTSKLQGKVRGY